MKPNIDSKFYSLYLMGILGNDLSGIGLEPTLDDGVDIDV